jgi:hypothetical protein
VCGTPWVYKFFSEPDFNAINRFKYMDLTTAVCCQVINRMAVLGGKLQQVLGRACDIPVLQSRRLGWQLTLHNLLMFVFTISTSAILHTRCFESADLSS